MIFFLPQAKNELAQHLGEDPLPLRRAKITTEAATKKAERATKAAEEAAAAARVAAAKAAEARAAAEEAVAEAQRKVSSKPALFCYVTCCLTFWVPLSLKKP